MQTAIDFIRVKQHSAVGGTRVMAIHPVDASHRVVTVESGWRHRCKVCLTCPWRIDAIGDFPAEAFRISANTAYDMSRHLFSCHESGAVKPAVCAGFLLRGAEHNLQVRLALITGKYRGDADDGDTALHDNYRSMAVANGVAEDDPTLINCRD